MALNKLIKASSVLEAIVSIAIISAIMLIVFPFFGQVLSSNHQMEIMRGLQLIQEIENNSNNMISENNEDEFSSLGVTVQRMIKPHEEIPDLFVIQTKIQNTKKKIIYSYTEYKYNRIEEK